MNPQDISAIAEIVGSIAIVATLVYLAIQMKQNTNALLATSRGTTMMADVTMLSSIINHATAVYGDEDLSAEQQRQFEIFLAMYLRIREFAWFQHQNGILDEATWKAYMGPTKRILSTPQGKNTWALISSELDPIFVAYIEAALERP